MMTRLYSFLLPLVCTAIFVMAGFTPRPALAGCCNECGCVFAEHAGTQAFITQQHIQTNMHFESEMSAHETWIIEGWFKGHLLPALMMMTEQMTTMAMQHAFAIGSFMDADQQLKTQRTLQERAARAHKDYQPSVAMCSFGTNARNLAAAEMDSHYTANALNRQALARNTGLINASGSIGNQSDREGRTERFLDTFCDSSNLNPVSNMLDKTGMAEICRAHNDGTYTAQSDIDFTNSVMLPRILNMDTKDAGNHTDDAILQMASYLYGHRIFNDISATSLRKTEAADEIMDMRSLIAKRSVAQNSFNHLVSLKSVGMTENGAAAGSTAKYLKAVLAQLGVPEGQTGKYLMHLGNLEDDDEVSYYAQMELLAKRLYQSPDFYTNLYDKPANLRRQAVAMQAIGLMLERDIYESYQRSELLLSLLLEARIQPLQDKVQENINSLVDTGEN
jgi:hypothetical protein